jgi:hypothetical protein
MAFGIMGAARNSHMLTYQNTRPVGCLYFDGESATLMGTGQLDTQMLFIYGNTTGNPPDNRWMFLWDEYDRASKLCQWVQEKGVGGLGWGVEGIVRMNAGFEMIWCNFTSPSLRLVSRLNVTAPLLPETPEDTFAEAERVDKEAMPSNTYYPLPTKTTRKGGGPTTDPAKPPAPPNWRGQDREPFREMASWGWFESATWHYGSSGIGRGGGENRVKLLTCGFLNFYSPHFQSQQRARAENEQKSLNLTADGLWRGPGEGGNRSTSLRELNRRRRNHDLSNITREDASAMNDATERALRNLGFDKKRNRAAANCTGIDWSAAINDIVQRHDLRLRELSNILTNDTILVTSNITILRDWFSTVRPRTYFLLLPYFEYPHNLRNGFDAADDPWSISSPSAQLALSRCRSHYTRLLAPDQGIALNPEEVTLAWAVEETLSGICNVVIDVGFAVEREWLRRFNIEPLTDTGLLDLDILRKEIRRWREGVEELMAWLGWAGQWTECQPGCAWDEICTSVLTIDLSWHFYSFSSTVLTDQYGRLHTNVAPEFLSKEQTWRILISISPSISVPVPVPVPLSWKTQIPSIWWTTTTPPQ